ncbi:MAG: methionine--tRNA ligase [Phycisphaeraceae bacterium]
MAENRFYVTTPIYYVNDRPHIGHVYTTTVADVVARYHRLRGDETFFLTGTDEHALKVVDAARERNLTSQQWADRNAEAFQQTFSRLEMTHDDFIRTSQQRHVDRVKRYVSQLMDSGDVYLGEYEGWYDAGQEEYVPENKAKENDYKSPFGGKPLVRKKEKNYFFRLSAYQDKLLELLEKGDVFDVQPLARKNEVIARIREGLNDVPMSRRTRGDGDSSDWGIRVPGDDNHTIYVWIDALINYLSTVDTDDRRHFWPCDVHLIAKDILWFHAVIWPAMLMALSKQPGYDWVKLPRLVYAHSFWIAEGQKMSKSLGNFIDLEKIDSYVETFGLDSLRYFLAAHGPLGTTDSDFAENKFIDTYNADLANTIGNSASRVANMIGRYFGGKLPEPGESPEGTQRYDHVAERNVGAYNMAIKTLQLDKACDAALELVREVDQYIEQTQPFKLAKQEGKMGEVGTILYNCAESLRIASILLWPILPERMETYWKRIGCGHYAEALQEHRPGEFDAWTKWGQLRPGTPIEKGDPLFPRYQPEKV